MTGHIVSGVLVRGCAQIASPVAYLGGDRWQINSNSGTRARCESSLPSRLVRGSVTHGKLRRAAIVCAWRGARLLAMACRFVPIVNCKLRSLFVERCVAPPVHPLYWFGEYARSAGHLLRRVEDTRSCAVIRSASVVARYVGRRNGSCDAIGRILNTGRRSLRPRGHAELPSWDLVQQRSRSRICWRETVGDVGSVVSGSGRLTMPALITSFLSRVAARMNSQMFRRPIESATTRRVIVGVGSRRFSSVRCIA